MATDYTLDGSRIGIDGASSISWQGVCEALIADWDKSDQAIVAATAASGSHTPASESFQIRWRNKTDYPAGAFAALITGSGELRAGTSAGCITNTDPVGANCGCHDVALGDTEETENESPLQTASLSAGTKDYSIEVQACVDFSNALDGKEYEFELYSITGTASVGILTATITVTAPTVAYKDITLKVSLESNLTYKDITIKTTIESIPIFKDITLKTSFSAAPALAYKDITLKTTFESTLTYKDILLKTTLESIPTYKDVILKTTIQELVYKDIALKTSLEPGEVLVYKDITLKTTLESNLTYKDITLKTTLESIPTYKDVVLKITLESIPIYKDIELKTTLESNFIYKDIALKTSLVPEGVVYYYKDVSIKVSLYVEAVETINFISKINQIEELVSSITPIEEFISSINQTENFISKINS